MVPVKYLLSRTACLLFIFAIIIGFHLPLSAAENAYYDFGIFAYEEGNFPEAVKYFIKALATDPENPRYNRYMGKTCLETGKYKEAKKYLKKALRKKPDHLDIKYDLAMANFNTADYSSADFLFSEILEIEPANTLARYYLAMCKFKQERYGYAADHFIKASEESSDIRPNCFYYSGICYLKTGRPKEAAKKFEYVINHSESPEVKIAAEKWLGSAQRLEKELAPYSLYLKLGARYDDNVQLEPLDLDIYSNESDIAGVGFFSGTYELFKNSHLGMSAGYDHYQTYYFDISGYDLTACSPNFSATYRINKLSEAGFSYTPTFYWLDYESYMLQHYFKPEISLKITTALSGKLSIDYIGKNNLQIPGRSGHASGVSTDFVYLFRERDISVSAGVSYLDNSPADSKYDYTDFETRLMASFQAPWNVGLAVFGTYKARDFDDVDSTFNIKRDDTKIRGAASASRWFFNNRMAIILEYSYTQNDSNITNYEYKKNTITLSSATKF
ncbi:MAG: tetratricopeptide repeat protein [Deltaproteobacteria bacterium]|nr:tetratricopeptide repeat protein [Deltaproteobacteria bacterium]MBW2219177.1 tetratricopeptide repeat protein [Deltaproteobacteria bacterium]